MSSGGTNNNFMPTRGNWWHGQGPYGDRAPSSSDRNRVVHPTIPRPPYGVALNLNRGSLEPWLLPAQEIPTMGPLGFASYLVPPLSPMGFPVLDEMARDNNTTTRHRQYSIQESPPGLMGQQRRNVQLVPSQEEESRLTQDEQKTALKKLKKEIYNPTATPKKMAKRVSLYYRHDANARNSFEVEGKEEDEDGKRCAICLDDFEPKQLVMLTPCSHMFHEECIVRWVRSHGQCPVCRFAICERMRQHALPQNNNNAQAPASELFAGELMAIIRAVDEAFEWRGTYR